MANLKQRLEKLEAERHGNLIYPVTSQGSKGYYIGTQYFGTLQDVQRAYPGSLVKPIKLAIKADLGEL